MYRSTWEADRARIVALEQELADARNALAVLDATRAPPADETSAQPHARLTLALIFGGLLVLNIVSCCVQTSQPVTHPDEESVPMKVLREL